MKVCSTCKSEKLYNCFPKKGNQCKECIRERDRKYREINKDKAVKYRKEYSQVNKEKLAVKMKKYRKNNKEKILLYQKKYYDANKERFLNYTKKYSKKYSKERIEKRNSNPMLKFKHRVRNLVLTSFKRKSSTFRKNTKTEIILGCTIEDFKVYIESKFKEGMSIDNHGLWELDHIIPLSSAKTKEEIEKLNHYTNFQPLWAKDNRSKKNKIIEQQLTLI